jgi:hypothetical protein
LRDLYFGNYTHLLYLRQLHEQDAGERAQAAAQKLGLRYVEIDTGLDVLEQRLVEIVRARAEQNERQPALTG